jgi:endonuclease YncB( thermonuclease family)
MNRRTQKKLLGLIAPLIVVGLTLVGQQLGWFDEAAKQVQQNDPGLYTVTRFSDGDTITVDMNGQKETIRMIGVDTPETHDPDVPVQCYGPAASAYTKNLIGTNKVRLEADPTNQNRDRYNRLLRYVYLPDGRLVQDEIIKNGYGFAYTLFPFTKSKDFVGLQDQAKTQNKGLWGNCKPFEEESGKWQTEAAG